MNKNYIIAIMAFLLFCSMRPHYLFRITVIILCTTYLSNLSDDNSYRKKWRNMMIYSIYRLCDWHSSFFGSISAQFPFFGWVLFKHLMWFVNQRSRHLSSNSFTQNMTIKLKIFDDEIWLRRRGFLTYMVYMQTRPLWEKYE